MADARATCHAALLRALWNLEELDSDMVACQGCPCEGRDGGGQ